MDPICRKGGPLRISADQSILPGELGVRCEVCHGPTTAVRESPHGSIGRIRAARIRVVREPE
jgi:hypothetical protein